MPLTKEMVIDTLRVVKAPQQTQDIVALDMVKEVIVRGDEVELTLAASAGAARESLEQGITAALHALGVVNPKINISSSAQAARQVLPQIANIVAIGAGKGGVGKSTVSANVAVALARDGARVGLMDGDIYGPSMPTMLGIRGVPPKVRGDKMMPHFVHGIHAVTIGSLVEQDKPLIWRGPMAHGAFKQLLLERTEWPELDYLIVDLPPGTGDVPLTLCQLLPLTGAVVVATPQRVALDDCIRAVRMFQQLGAPVLGILENMSYMPLPGGGEVDIFGRGGAERAAKDMGLPFIGALPLYTELRVNSDAGNPSANFESNRELGEALHAVARNLAREVATRNASAAGPTLEIS